MVICDGAPLCRVPEKRYVMSESELRDKILIIDDSPTSIEALSDTLKTDYTICFASDGEKGLELARSEYQPDLILLDVMMPGIDGYEVCRRLKSDQWTKNIPVIFLTARGEMNDEAIGFEVGAVDYISKPYFPVIVKARVKTHIELKKHRDTFEKLTLFDYLTGIANRRGFDEYFSKAWGYALRNSEPITVIMADIDHFKPYNDNYGHPAGDECLIAIAQALSGTFKRSIDVVCRFGGEEFICILPKISHSGAWTMAEKIKNAVISLNMVHEFSPTAKTITISMGIATTVPRRDFNPADLVKEADSALYESKRKGRNRITGRELNY